MFRQLTSQKATQTREDLIVSSFASSAEMRKTRKGRSLASATDFPELSNLFSAPYSTTMIFNRFGLRSAF
jgi:hypothetical protein